MTKLKKSGLALSAACAVALTGGLVALKTLPAAADGTRGYYGAQLSGAAQAFYDELVKMTLDPDGTGEETSEFIAGAPHSVESSVTAIYNGVADYKTGNAALVQAFGAARDSFRYDNPDLFYIDFDKLSLNVAETTSAEAPADGESTPATVTTVKIDAGKYENYFIDGVEQTTLVADIATYEGVFQFNATGTLMSNAMRKTGKLNEADFKALGAKEKAVAVNGAICEAVKYVYKDAGKVSSLMGTAYGAAVDKYADSDGYARLFKAMMNRLDVDCEIVSGYYLSGGTLQACTWNYVKDGDDWYGVDVANNYVTGEDYTQYLWLSAEYFGLEHFEDGYVSASNYKMPYPTLCVNGYAFESGKLAIQKGNFDGKAGFAISYDGMNADELSGEAALYLAVRVRQDDAWSPWVSLNWLVEQSQSETEETAEGEEEEEEGETSTAVSDNDNHKTYLYGVNENEFMIGVFNADATAGVYANESGLLESSAKVMQEGEAGVKPIVKIYKVGTPEEDIRKAVLESKKINIGVEYGELAEDGKVEIDVTAESMFASRTLTKGEAAAVKNYCKIESVTWAEAEHKLTFSFTPSPMLKHSGLKYNFTIKNLKAEDGSLPQGFSLVFSYNTVAASRVFGNDMLETGIVKTPTLFNNGAFSLNGWEYGGKAVTNAMRSQLVLNATALQADEKASAQEAVNKYIAEETIEKGGNQENVFAPGASAVKTDFYRLNLTLAGKQVTVPQNTRLKLSFPYPQDYGPESNVYYKVLCFPADGDGFDFANPQKLDVVKTWQGLTVAANEFSLYAVMVFENASANVVTQNILLQTNGVGGSVSAKLNGTAMAGPVYSMTETLEGVANTSLNYIFTITAEDGYTAIVNFNGEDKGSPQSVTVMFNGTGVSQDNVLYVDFVKTESVGEAAAAKAFAQGFVQNTMLKTTAYTEAEKNQIITVYPVGGFIDESEDLSNTTDPGADSGEDKPDTASTKMQLIIVLGVLIGLGVVGSIVIIYCAAIRPKILKEREEEAARIAANRERRANRNRMPMNNNGPHNNLPPPPQK